MITLRSFVACFAALFVGAAASAPYVIYDGPGVVVPADFLGMHCHRLVTTHGGLPMVPSITAKIGRFRQWDAEGVNEWDSVHKAPGRFDFSNWDLLMERLPNRPDGKPIPIEWTLGKPPDFAIDKTVYSDNAHYGFVPVRREMLKEVVKAMLSRYSNIKWIDVANEWDFGDNNGGSPDELAGFARGPVSSLADAIRWTREAIDETGRKDVTLFLGSTTGAKHQLRLLDRYPDLIEKVDAFAFHAYDGTAQNNLEPMGPRNGGIFDLRDGLRARGINKPIYDTEHGWMMSPDEGGRQSAKLIWDTLVFAALNGVAGVGFYSWDDSDGPLHRYTPFHRPAVREMLEKFAVEVQGRTIAKVVDPQNGEPWQVTTIRSTEHPKPMPVPGVRKETEIRYKANGSAEMTDPSLVQARGVRRRRGASPQLSMVRESSATVVSGASRIPFERSNRI